MYRDDSPSLLSDSSFVLPTLPSVPTQHPMVSVKQVTWRRLDPDLHQLLVVIDINAETLYFFVCVSVLPGNSGLLNTSRTHWNPPGGLHTCPDHHHHHPLSVGLYLNISWIKSPLSPLKNPSLLSPSDYPSFPGLVFHLELEPSSVDYLSDMSHVYLPTPQRLWPFQVSPCLGFRPAPST